MYKLLALDIDDTLLRRDLSLSPENKEAIQKARENGVIVILCTGRAYPGARKVCAMLDLNDLPVVTFGGAQINLYPSGEVLYQNVMPPSIVRDCISFARKHNVVLQCYEGDEFYYQENSEESRFYEERLGYSGIRTELDLLHFQAVQKCIMIAQPFMIDKLIPIAKKHFEGKAEVLRSYSRFLEFYNLGVSKGRAVAWLADYFDILQEEVIAMGDSELDISMIDYAGMGVAVANGSRSVLDSANYVAPHADQNAVAHVINKFLL